MFCLPNKFEVFESNGRYYKKFLICSYCKETSNIKGFLSPFTEQIYCTTCKNSDSFKFTTKRISKKDFYNFVNHPL